MADTVATRTLVDDSRHVGVLWTSVSDGTGESAVAKLTLAGVGKVDGGTLGMITPIALDLEWVQWTLTTFTSVDLKWHATTADLIVRCAGAYGTLDLTGRGILQQSIRTFGARDPLSTGHTGAIELTSNGAASGAVYNIVAFFRKRFLT